MSPPGLVTGDSGSCITSTLGNSLENFPEEQPIRIAAKATQRMYGHSDIAPPSSLHALLSLAIPVNNG